MANIEFALHEKIQRLDLQTKTYEKRKKNETIKILNCLLIG